MTKKSLASWLVIGLLGVGAVSGVVYAFSGGFPISIQNCNSCNFAAPADKVQEVAQSAPQQSGNQGEAQDGQRNLGASSGTRLPDGISADNTSPLRGEVRGTTLTITNSATVSGTLFVNTPVINQTSSLSVVANEPATIPSITAASAQAVYSDDLSRIIETVSSTAGSLYLRNGSFAAASQQYFGTTAQTITATTLLSLNSSFLGAVTYQGYHYVLAASTTVGNYIIFRATSSPNIDLSLKASWVTSTISGTAVTSSARLIGAAGGSLYITASTTSSTIPYAITVGSNTLTAGTPVFISNTAGTNIDFNSRVNDNGIYASFTAAPFIRKYTLAGVAVGGITNPLVAAPGNGPDLFVTKNSFYGLAGGSTAELTRMVGF